MSKYIEINGRKYDQETGLPLEMETGHSTLNLDEENKGSINELPHTKNYCATDIHGHMQKSKILSRKYTKPSTEFIRKQKIRQIIRENQEITKNSIYLKNPNKIRQEAPFNFNILKNSHPNNKKSNQVSQNTPKLSDQKYLQKVAPFNYKILSEFKKSEQKIKENRQSLSSKDLQKIAPFDYSVIKGIKKDFANSQNSKSSNEHFKTKNPNHITNKQKAEAHKITKNTISQNNTQYLKNNTVNNPHTSRPTINIQKRPLAIRSNKTENLGSSARANQIIARRNKKVINSIQPMKKSINDFKPIKNNQNLSTKTSDFHIPNPAEKRAHQIQAQRRIQNTQAVHKQTHTPSSIIKNNAIAEALSSAPKHNSAKNHKIKSTFKLNKIVGFASGFAALILFAGYVTYLNMPDISVKIAAAQAGIDAKYPGYKPSGYKLNGPIAYNDGRVKIKFHSVSGDKAYVLNQTKSGWDSKALLENYIKEKSDNEYATTREKGITVYTYDNGKAAWVSGGILYTIDGNAPLSPSQIRKIATSAV